MIFFATTTDNDHAMAWYLLREGARFRRTIVPITYDDLLAAPALPRRPTCSRISSSCPTTSERTRPSSGTASRHQGSRMLNHPTRTLRRYDLLRALHAAGRNQFAAYRPSDDLTGVRFPVFLRREDDHDGRRSGLLDDAATLSHALDDLAV